MTTRNTLNQGQMFQLAKVVEADYVKFGKSDAAFAKVSALKLKFKVTESNVAKARQMLNIPGSRKAGEQTPRSLESSRLHRDNRSIARAVLHIWRELGMEDGVHPGMLENIKTIAEKM